MHAPGIIMIAGGDDQRIQRAADRLDRLYGIVRIAYAVVVCDVECTQELASALRARDFPVCVSLSEFDHMRHRTLIVGDRAQAAAAVQHVKHRADVDPLVVAVP